MAALGSREREQATAAEERERRNRQTRPAQSRPNPVARFARETAGELQKVVWPEPQELWRMTIVVIGTVVAIAIFIGLVDYALQVVFTPIYQ